MKKILLSIGILLTGTFISHAQIGVSSIGVSVPGRDTLAVSVIGKSLTDTCLFPVACLLSLPLEEIELTARRVNELEVVLNWEAAFYQHNRGFWVERSDGAANRFAPQFFVPVQHNGTTATMVYRQPDANSFNGRSYYRIKQVDADGRYMYSNIAVVTGMAGLNTLQVFPVPAVNQATIRLPGALKNAGQARLVLNNAQGNEVMNVYLPVINNEIKVTQLNRLPPGVYMVTVWVNQQSLNGRMIVAR